MMPDETKQTPACELDRDNVIERRMFDEAIRLGDFHADRVIDLANDVRRLRKAMYHAVACLQTGKADKALVVLKAGLKT